MEFVEQFEYAYYWYLKRIDFRPLMVECGVNLLLSGKYEDVFCALAGADHDDEEELLEYFMGSGELLSINFPSASLKNYWLVIKEIEFREKGYSIPERPWCELAYDFECSICQVLSEINKLKKYTLLTMFVERYLNYGEPVAPVSYEKRCIDLSNLCLLMNEKLNEDFIVKTCQRLVDLNFSYAYGAILEEHAKEGQEILKDIVAYTQKNLK